MSAHAHHPHPHHTPSAEGFEAAAYGALLLIGAVFVVVAIVLLMVF